MMSTYSSRGSYSLISSPGIKTSQDEQAILSSFLDIIPETLDPALKLSPKHFTRTSKLPFPKVITATLSIVASPDHTGVDIHSGTLFRDARRSGLWPDAEAIHRSTVTKARNNVPWQVFRGIHDEAVALADELWPDRPQEVWHGMSVVATDGSKYTLPASESLRKEFDPTSGLGTPGKGHYPQCLVSTLYDVFRRIPLARTVVGINGSERDEVEELLPSVPANSVWLFDRGYPSYELFHRLTKTFDGFFLFRCPASSTFPAVEEFMARGRHEAIIWVTPSHTALTNVSPRQRKRLKALKLRVIRVENPDGTLSALITNLLDTVTYPCLEIMALYVRRWEVEEYYRDEKVTLDIEYFHSKTPNGVRQELFAAMIMSVISRTLMMLAAEHLLPEDRECQFKNAIVTLASEAALLAPDAPEQAVIIFRDVLAEIARVKYYRPKTPRSSQPRINKHPVNKWSKRNRTSKT